MTDMIYRADAIARFPDGRQPWSTASIRKALDALPAAQVAVSDDMLRQAIGRAWCHEENVAKEMDVDIAEAVLREIRAVMTIAASATPDPAVNADSRQPTLAAKVIATHGEQATATAMILHIAETLRQKGKAILTSDHDDFGTQVLEFAAALAAFKETTNEK